jgi:serine/threonine protein phosphatase PrpC
VQFETATLSSAGGRENNEDCCGHTLNGAAGCWVLCDGLGGHRGGEIASKTAVDAVLESFRSNPAVTAEALAAHVDRAQQAVVEKQIVDPELTGMRTTLVLLAAAEDAARWMHVGDSRLYWFRDGKIREQTRDHSVPQRLADAGEITINEIRFHEDRSRLLRSLGAAKQDPGAAAGAMPSPPEPGDTFLLASDGFWEWVLEEEMEASLAASKHSKQWLERMEAQLRQRATGEFDNYSAIAVRCTL